MRGLATCFSLPNNGFNGRRRNSQRGARAQEEVLCSKRVFLKSSICTLRPLLLFQRTKRTSPILLYTRHREAISALSLLCPHPRCSLSLSLLVAAPKLDRPPIPRAARDHDLVKLEMVDWHRLFAHRSWTEKRNSVALSFPCNPLFSASSQLFSVFQPRGTIPQPVRSRSLGIQPSESLPGS